MAVWGCLYGNMNASNVNFEPLCFMLGDNTEHVRTRPYMAVGHERDARAIWGFYLRQQQQSLPRIRLENYPHPR